MIFPTNLLVVPLVYVLLLVVVSAQDDNKKVDEEGRNYFLRYFLEN